MIVVVFLLLLVGAVASVLGIVWSRGPSIALDDDGVTPYFTVQGKGERLRGTLAVAIGLGANTAASFISLFMAL